MGIPKITQMAINAALSGGGGKREGTAIPSEKRIELIYFNINNTKEETNAILSQLTFIQTDLLPDPLYPILASSGGSFSKPLYLFVVKNGEEYTIMGSIDIASGEAWRVYCSEEWAGVNGWISDFSMPCVASAVFIGGRSASEFMGMPVGAENEKIKNVLSITPF